MRLRTHNSPMPHHFQPTFRPIFLAHESAMIRWRLCMYMGEYKLYTESVSSNTLSESTTCTRSLISFKKLSYTNPKEWSIQEPPNVKYVIRSENFLEFRDKGFWLLSMYFKYLGKIKPKGRLCNELETN